MFHIALHFLVPIFPTLLCRYRPALLLPANRISVKPWKTVTIAYVLMLATMLVDLDHLLATPVYDPLRCSIGFHPLHGLLPIAVYALMCLPMRSRIFGIGLLIHMALDAIDCLCQALS
jgi:hypothetical protein